MPSAFLATKRIILSLGLTLALIGLVFLLWGHEAKDLLQRSTQTLTEFSPMIFGAVFLIACIQFSIQILKFWHLSRASLPVGWARLSYGLSLGQFLNHLIPSRAGDFVKVYVIGDLRHNQGYRLKSSANVSGVLIADKLTNLVALILLVAISGISTPFHEFGKLNQALTLGLPIGVLGALMLYLGIRRFPRLYRSTQIWTKTFIHALRILERPQISVVNVGIGLSLWLCEVTALFVMTESLQLNVPFWELSLVILALNIGIAIPVTFGNLLTFEAAMVVGFLWLGVSEAPALAIALTYHLFQILSIGCFLIVTTLLHNRASLSRRTQRS